MRYAATLNLVLLVLATVLFCGCKVDRSAKPGPDDTPAAKDFEKSEGFEAGADRSFGQDTEKEQPDDQKEGQ